MRSKINKLFRFNKPYKVYELEWYRGADDPTITELEIPAKYRFRPVVSIEWGCFRKCKYLRRVYIPDSVHYIESEAFSECDELREIRLPPKVSFGHSAFVKCPKLDPETVLAGCIGHFTNIDRPLDPVGTPEWDELLRPDVFSLTIEYDSFSLYGREKLYNELVRRGLCSHFEMLEQAGRLPSAEETDALIKFCIENRMTEMTAYLLDLKNRKFGFDGGNDLEL